MKFNKLTVGLAAVGVVSLASAACADETNGMTKMSQLQTALSNTTISGYVDTAAIWRPGTDQNPTSDGANIPPYSFSKNDGFYLNAIDIAIDKPQDETPWAAGYHVEMMYGPDSEPDANGGGADNAYNVRQAYLALRTPIGSAAIDWKVGVWDDIIGYESTSDPLNPNYTRSYGYTIEPTTYTGILGTFKVNDMISVQAGIADSGQSQGLGGINSGSAIESQKAYLGAIALTAPDSFGWAKGATLNVGVIDAAGYYEQTYSPTESTGTAGSTSLYAGLTVPTPLAALKVGAAFDYLDIHDGFSRGIDSRGNNSVWVVGGYATYQINDKTSLNGRAEYLADHGAYEGSENAEEVTATLQYNLWANVLSRLEFRWDHVEDTKAFGANSYYGEFSEPFRSNDFMLAANLIYQF